METINELERTRNMLAVQHRINEDFQQEVDNLRRRLSLLQMEYDTRIAEQAKILELRAIRIQRLERQMKDIAYGVTCSSLNLEEPPVGSLSYINSKYCCMCNMTDVVLCVRGIRLAACFSHHCVCKYNSVLTHGIVVGKKEISCGLICKNRRYSMCGARCSLRQRTCALQVRRMDAQNFFRGVSRPSAVPPRKVGGLL